MYPEHLVHPMRMDIVEGGFKELSSASEVEDTMAQPGTTLLFIIRFVVVLLEQRDQV